MSHYQHTQLARSPLLLLDYAEHHGMNRQELMQEAALLPQQLADPDSRVATSSMIGLWRAVMRRDEDPALGLHIGGKLKARQLGLVGYAMSYSSSLGDALRRLTRYARILSEAVQYDLDVKDETAVFSGYVHPSLLALRHPIEAGLAAVIAIAREITQTKLAPLAIDLPLQNTHLSPEYRKAFGCAVRFEQPIAAVLFSAAQMSLPNRLADPTLGGYLDDLASIKLGSLRDGDDMDLVSRVRETLWDMLPGGRSDLWRTASTMGMSARTLQRRLGERGTSFSRVLDDLRRELSEELLTGQKLAVSEVAFLLGYSEPRAFQRAFRRWRGVSPKRFRTG